MKICVQVNNFLDKVKMSWCLDSSLESVPILQICKYLQSLYFLVSKVMQVQHPQYLSDSFVCAFSLMNRKLIFKIRTEDVGDMKRNKLYQKRSCRSTSANGKAIGIQRGAERFIG